MRTPSAISRTMWAMPNVSITGLPRSSNLATGIVAIAPRAITANAMPIAMVIPATGTRTITTMPRRRMIAPGR